MRAILFIAATVSCCVSISYASWRNPVFCRELNDFPGGNLVFRPAVSTDGTLLYFTRSTPTKVDALWEARRNPVTGVFEQMRQVAELKNGGSNVYGAWISPDKLRFYYAGSDPQVLGWGRRCIWMVYRNSLDSQWQHFRRLTELEIMSFQTCCTLTADEKTIMWETSSFGEGGLKRIFLGSRPSPINNFANFREATELEAVEALTPRMSGDGLRVYFRRTRDDGTFDAWVGRRESLDMPFGDFVPMADINAQGLYADVCPPTEQKELFYFQRLGGVGDVYANGIYISQWVDDSYPDMMACLERAMAKKQAALRLLSEASQEEQTAYGLLTTLPPPQMPPFITPKHITEAMKNLERSMAKQEQLITVLDGCIRNVQASLFFLLPPLPQ